MVKKCSKCGRVLLSENFREGRAECKLCERDYRWQHNYGITPDDYYEMSKQQEGKCKICGKLPPKGEYLHVDHNPKTGKVRGLLCKKCNTALGSLDENLTNIARAMIYLEKEGDIS